MSTALERMQAELQRRGFKLVQWASSSEWHCPDGFEWIEPATLEALARAAEATDEPIYAQCDHEHVGEACEDPDCYRREAAAA